MWACPGNRMCCADVLPKRVKRMRNVKCEHSKGIIFLSCYPSKACKTQEERQMQAFPGKHHFCPDVFPHRVKHKRNVKCKHSTRIPVVALIPSPSVQNPKEMPRHQFLWSDILSKRVKNKRNVQCVHPQGIKFVVLMSSQSM